MGKALWDQGCIETGLYGPGMYDRAVRGQSCTRIGCLGTALYGHLGCIETGVYGPVLHGPGVYGPALHGPGVYWPALHGPGVYGPALHGPGVYGDRAVWAPGLYADRTLKAQTDLQVHQSGPHYLPDQREVDGHRLHRRHHHNLPHQPTVKSIRIVNLSQPINENSYLNHSAPPPLYINLFPYQCIATHSVLSLRTRLFSLLLQKS